MKTVDGGTDRSSELSGNDPEVKECGIKEGVNQEVCLDDGTTGIRGHDGSVLGWVAGGAATR